MDVVYIEPSFKSELRENTHAKWKGRKRTFQTSAEKITKRSVGCQKCRRLLSNESAHDDGHRNNKNNYIITRLVYRESLLLTGGRKFLSEVVSDIDAKTLRRRNLSIFLAANHLPDATLTDGHILLLLRQLPVNPPQGSVSTAWI